MELRRDRQREVLELEMRAAENMLEWRFHLPMPPER
jgi:hypothetical protein